MMAIIRLIPFCKFVIFLINLMKTGIGESKYCSYGRTLFDQSLPLSLLQKFILLITFHALIAIFFDPTLSKIDLTRFFL